MRDAAPIPRIGSTTANGREMLPPRRCVLKIAHMVRPEADPALGVAIWQVADEQAVGPEARLALQANGMRLGRVAGELPPDVETVLKANGPRRAEVQTIVIADGEDALIDPSTAATDSLNLILDQKGKAVGKVYQDPRGFLRVTARFDGKDGVALRVSPEVHHGEPRRDWGVSSGATPLTPKQFVIHEGPQEENFRELAATLVLQPGQVAVLGARPERMASLGAFLFSEPERNSDRPLRKVILIWADRSESAPADAPANTLIPVEPSGEPTS